MRQHGFEAAAEVAEVISTLVHLHALAVVLDLRVHSVRTLLHGVFNRLAGFRLKKIKTKTRTRKSFGKIQNCLINSRIRLIIHICSIKSFILKVKALTSMGCTGVSNVASTLKCFLGPLPFDASC